MGPRFTTESDIQMQHIYDAKASIAAELAQVVRTISETGVDEDNTLKDIVKLARILDIAAPARSTNASTLIDPRYNLLDYIKRSANSRVVKNIDADAILFEKDKPFTCIGQIQAIFQDVAEKISKNFVTVEQAQYA